MPLSDCPDCGSSHLGPGCGMTFAERLRTVQVDVGALESRDRVRYFDDEAVGLTFAAGESKPLSGPERKELYLDETHGLGTVRTAKDGTLMRTDSQGHKVALTEKQAKVIVGASE